MPSATHVEPDRLDHVDSTLSSSADQSGRSDKLDDETPLLDMGTYVYSLLCTIPLMLGAPADRGSHRHASRQNTAASQLPPSNSRWPNVVARHVTST
eukprot:gene8614-34056_t